MTTLVIVESPAKAKTIARGQGELVEKHARSGRVFWGCSEWQRTKCDGVSWYQPLRQRCPTCDGFLVEVGRAQTRCLACDGELPRRSGASGERAAPTRGRAAAGPPTVRQPTGGGSDSQPRRRATGKRPRRGPATRGERATDSLEGPRATPGRRGRHRFPACPLLPVY